MNELTNQIDQLNQITSKLLHKILSSFDPEDVREALQNEQIGIWINKYNQPCITGIEDEKDEQDVLSAGGLIYFAKYLRKYL